MLIHFRGQYMDRPFEFTLTFESCDVTSGDWDLDESSIFYKPFLVPSVIQRIESHIGRTIDTFKPANHDFVEIREVVDSQLPADDEEWADLTLRHVNVNISLGRNWSRFR